MDVTNWIVGIALAALVAAGAAVWAVSGSGGESPAVEEPCLALADGQGCLGGGTCDGICEEHGGECSGAEGQCSAGGDCRKPPRGSNAEDGSRLGGDCEGNGQGGGRCRGSTS